MNNPFKGRSLMLCALLCLCGCAPVRQSTTAKTKLNVAIFHGAYDPSYWQFAKEAFEEAHPDVEVVLNINANIGTILMPRMQVSDVPDVVYLGSTNDSGYTQRMIQEQRILSLDDVFDESLQERFLPGLLESRLLRPYEDGSLYLAPLYYNVTGLWYNKKLFQTYGYQLPTTWEEFLSLGEQAKQDGIYLFTYQGLTPAYLEAMLWPMLAEQIGLDGCGRIFRNEAGAWEQDGIKEVLEVFEQIAKQHDMADDTIILTYTQAQQRFINGESLFLPCGNWLPQEMSVDIENGNDYGFMSVPQFDLKSKRYATIMVEQIYVPKDAKQPELAKAFVKEQFSARAVEANQKQSGGFVPVRQDQNTVDDDSPFHIFQEGVIPITIDFDLGTGRLLEKELYEQLSLILGGVITSQEMIDHMIQW